ncbi:unnamed protein product [marine sediment metagenome]|uniref:Uncharacterized protein n=1 Tax=marine sediment metagenome TaxID=412755 RepID=X0VKM0_9ZZZZ
MVEQKENDVNGGDESGGKQDESKEGVDDAVDAKHDGNEAKPEEERDNNL